MTLSFVVANGLFLKSKSQKREQQHSKNTQAVYSPIVGNYYKYARKDQNTLT